MRRRVAIGLALAIGVPGLVIAAATAAGVRLNDTCSMPRGLWRLEQAPARLARGMVVVVCLPPGPVVRLALRRGYIGPGNCPGKTEPLLKPVAAVAGDVVHVTAAGIAIDGVPVQNSAPLAHDDGGRPLHRVPDGYYRIGPGRLWLLSTHAVNSFDGRYFGPVPVAAVQSLAWPLWVIP